MYQNTISSYKNSHFHFSLLRLPENKIIGLASLLLPTTLSRIVDDESQKFLTIKQLFVNLQEETTERNNLRGKNV